MPNAQKGASMALATFSPDSGGSASFQGRVVGSSQESDGPLERLTVGVVFPSEAAWSALYALRSTRYSVRQSLSGVPIVHVAGGPGVGDLTIPGYRSGGYRGILTGLSRGDFAGAETWTGVATFLVEEA